MIAALLLLAIAATQTPIALTDEDRRDIRCAWAFQNAVGKMDQGDRSRDILFATQMWFEGKVVGRHPTFGVSSEITRRLFNADPLPDDAELTDCANRYLHHGQDDLSGALSVGAP